MAENHLAALIAAYLISVCIRAQIGLATMRGIALSVVLILRF